MRARVLSRGVRTLVAVALVGAALPGVARADAVRDVLGDAGAVENRTDPQAPAQVEAGIWRVMLPEAPSYPQQLAYTRTIRYSSVHVSAYSLLDPDDAVDLAVAVGGTECGSDSLDADTSGSWAHVPVGAVVSVADDDANDACMTAKSLAITVARSDVSVVDGALPVLLKIVEEAPLDDPSDATDQGDLPAAPVSDETIVLPTPADAREADEPGAGLDDATEGPGTFRSTLGAGEVHFYRVPVGWGQTLAARVDVDPVPKPDPESFVSTGPDLRVLVINPLRARIPGNLLETDADGPVNYQDDDGTAEPLTLSNGLGPVVWRGRHSGEVSYLPGEHWVMVARAAAGDGEEPEEIPYTVTIEVQGKVAGTPVYVEEPAFVVDAQGRAADPSGGQPSVEESGWLTPRRGIGAGLVAGGLLCLLLGALRIRRAT